MAEAPRLFDAYDRPVNLAALRREHAAPQVLGVCQVWQDTVASGLTLQRLAALLQCANKGDHHDYLTLAEEIEERDSHYRSVLRTRRLAVAGLEPTVEAAGEDARPVELADAVRELTREPGICGKPGNLVHRPKCLYVHRAYDSLLHRILLRWRRIESYFAQRGSADGRGLVKQAGCSSAS